MDEITYGFNLPMLLKLGDLDIRGVAAKNKALPAAEYCNKLSQFVRNAPSNILCLIKISEMAGDETILEDLSAAKDLLTYIGYQKLVPDFEGILDAQKKGDKVLAVYYSKRILPELEELYKRTSTAYKGNKTADRLANHKMTRDSLQMILKRIDYNEDNRKLRVLAVDDASFMLQTISLALKNDYEVFSLSKPTLVEKFLRHTTPELFLLDYTMPEISGFDLVHIIRSFEEHKDTPIIFLTAMGTSYHVMTAATLGACDYVVKPLNADILREKIAKHIVRKRAF